MADQQTVPMIAPDGSSGDIPLANADAAAKAGFKRAVVMTSPDGQNGYIPFDRQQDAMKAGFKVAAPPAPPQEGFFKSLASGLGIPTSVDEAKAGADQMNPLHHPIKALAGPAGMVASALYQQGKQSFNDARAAVKDYRGGNMAQAGVDALHAIPIVGPAELKAADQYGAGNKAGAAGTIVSAAAQAAPIVAGASDTAAPGRPVIPTPSVLSDAPATIKAKLYPTSKSIPQQTIAARNLAKALVIDPNGASNFIRAATDEAGTVVDFAQKNNIPINSKVDFANAAKQAADTVQAHFNDELLGPNAKTRVAVPQNYRGVGNDGLKIGESPNYTPKTATLGDIDARIDAINQELNPNYRKGLSAQTSAANVSDGDLLAEKRALTTILHNSLADATGLSPADIAAVRQQAGKLRTIADEANLSSNRDLTAAGRQSAGGTSASSLGTKTGLIDRAWQGVQGGADIIGNRELLKALPQIRPQPLMLPQPAPLTLPLGR